jgi:hypothetical protein
LDGCRVEQYAVRPRRLTFTGHGLLFRDGKEVGPVPRLALGRLQDGEVILFHCDKRWNVKGASHGCPTVRAAKQRAERFYPGISAAWRRTGYTRSQARRVRERSGYDRKCSLCLKRWFDVHQIIEIKKRNVALCDECIRKLHDMLSQA